MYKEDMIDCLENMSLFDSGDLVKGKRSEEIE
jgi:hypothetical protein